MFFDILQNNKTIGTLDLDNQKYNISNIEEKGLQKKLKSILDTCYQSGISGSFNKGKIETKKITSTNPKFLLELALKLKAQGFTIK